MTVRLAIALLAGVALSAPVFAADEFGPFFEPEQPFFQSQLEIVPRLNLHDPGANFVVRGLILPTSSGICVAFDQELLRVAAIWRVPAGQPPITLETMAQISYANPHHKVDSDHPHPTGVPWLATAMHPGAAVSVSNLLTDPRPPMHLGDEGRGALPVSVGRFDGVELRGGAARLHYHLAGVAVQEWFSTQPGDLTPAVASHFVFAAHSAPLLINLGRVGSAQWDLSDPAVPAADLPGQGRIRCLASFPGAQYSLLQTGELALRVAAAGREQSGTVTLSLGEAEAGKISPGPAEPLPAAAGQRWPGSVITRGTIGVMDQNGLLLDRIELPEPNPWKRRVRVADIAFLPGDRAAVLTYDGDVWMVDGLGDQGLNRVEWRRFASGLSEPLAVQQVNGIVQVATKNGVVRLHDRSGGGEADWYENFNDQLIQSQTTRSFPLDMAVAPDGSTYIAQGGIVNQSGLRSGGTGTPQTGGILKIAPDGRSSFLFADKAREPFFTVHPVTGVMTATDQQGHFVPSSVVYLVRSGDGFGFPEDRPAKLTPPLVWIPHDQDSSSTSQAWMIGERMGVWNNRLIHLSYGTGRLFIVAPDFDAPVPQGAAIPLQLETDLPLLHARMDPRGNAVFLTGFQIWGSRVKTMTFLSRLRPGRTPVTTAVGARSTRNGVIVEFAEPLDPESVRPEKVAARVWNYQRSSAYGSGRFNPDGTPGTTRWGVAQTVLSLDRKSVFVYLPSLTPVMQLEIDHDFRSAGGAELKGEIYLTINAPHDADLALAGFPPVDFNRREMVTSQETERPVTAETGHRVAEQFGCVACHSIDGTTAGKVGPTWFRLFGSTVKFADGTTAVADEAYLREKIREPMKHRVGTGQVEMPSFRGVLSDPQLESVIQYIRTLTYHP